MRNHIKELSKEYQRVTLHTDEEISEYERRIKMFYNLIFATSQVGPSIICPVNTLDGTHQWDYSSDKCILCGTTSFDLFNSGLHTQPLTYTKLTSSCCPNGSPNNIKWSGYSSQWECSSCGAPKSNDPNYLWSGRTSDTPKVAATSNKCECGSSKVGSDRHSDYCPLYKDKK